MTTEQGIIICFCAILVILVIQFARNQKMNKENFLRRAREAFGAVPDREYEVEELERVSHYFKNYKKKAEFYLDDLTWNDLGMEDIFLLMNQTYSSIGEDYLYWLLRTPVSDEKVLREREALICYFQTHEPERLRLQYVYQQLGRMRKHSISDYLIRLKNLTGSGNLIHYLVILAEAVSVGTLFLDSSAGVLCLIASFGYGAYSYYRHKAAVEPYYDSLKQISGMLRYTDELIVADCKELQGYYQELKALKKECAGLPKGIGLITSGGMAGSPQEMVLEYVRIFTHIDLIQFQRMLKILKEKEQEISRMLEIYGYIESMIAVASFRELLGAYCVPEFVSSDAGALHVQREARATSFPDSKNGRPQLTIEEMYHPQIDAPVTNSIQTTDGVLITGSNASGKSTFLKTVGICAVLAQTIMTVPAKRYQADFFKLYSSMAIKDDLSLKESYYLAEIKALRRILQAGEDEQAKNGYVLCLVDEVLRGTNTVERIAASAQVLKGLSGSNVLCFAATHDIELTYMLEHFYTNYHFEEEICEGDIRFDYRIREGRAVTRNAIRLLALLGYPEEMIEAADETAKEFMEKGEWRCL